MNGELGLGFRGCPRAARSYDDFFRWVEDCFHEHASAPRTIKRADCISVPAQPPAFVRGVVADETRANAEAVLRSDTASGDVERMVGEQDQATTAEGLEVEARATRFQSLRLTAKSACNWLSCAGADPATETKSRNRKLRRTRPPHLR